MPPLLIRNSLGTPGTPVSGPPGSSGSLVIPGRLAPPTPAAPAPPAPPSTPATTDYTSKANDIVSSGLAAGTDWANKVLPDGTLTRISDPRAGEVNDYLAKLKERTGGMDSAEMLAAKEQNQQYSDQALAQNERRLSGIAGAAGVRGGAAAGLQATAIQQSQQSRDALQRQLVLDNIDQQNKAFASYGGALTGQQGTELGIQTYNGGQSDKEKLGRPALATQYYGMVDSAASGLRADDQTKAATTTAQDYLKSLKTPATAPAAPPGTGTTVPVQSETTQRLADSISKDMRAGMTTVDPATGKEVYTDDNKTGPSWKDTQSKIQDYVNEAFPNLTESERKQKASQMYWDEYNKVRKEFGRSETPRDTAPPTVICTEAMRQGTVSRLVYAAALRTGADMAPDVLAAYQIWGVKVVAAMRGWPLFARLVSWFVPDTLRAIRGAEHYGLRGVIGYGVFRACNRLVRLFRGR